jgi:hypothetical protein
MIDSLRAMLNRTWAVIAEQAEKFLPKLIVGLAILLIGFILARIIRGLVARLFLAIRLDRLSDRVGISAFLARGDVRHTVAEILATAVYWLVLIFSLQVLALTLGLGGMASFFGQVLGYIPRLVAALVIILVGIAIGAFFGSAVQVASSNVGFPAAKPLGAVVKYLISFFALVMALEHLQIVTQLLITTMEIVIAAIAFALALAFGLGCKDLAGRVVSDWVSKSDRSHKGGNNSVESN